MKTMPPIRSRSGRLLAASASEAAAAHTMANAAMAEIRESLLFNMGQFPQKCDLIVLAGPVPTIRTTCRSSEQRGRHDIDHSVKGMRVLQDSSKTLTGGSDVEATGDRRLLAWGLGLEEGRSRESRVGPLIRPVPPPRWVGAACM